MFFYSLLVTTRKRKRYVKALFWQRLRPIGKLYLINTLTTVVQFDLNSISAEWNFWGRDDESIGERQFGGGWDRAVP